MFRTFLHLDSNTTLVKVKLDLRVARSLLKLNSNTTLVNVKLINNHKN